MNIGKRIKEIRINLGLSADDVAEALGKDRSTIYRYESNEIEKLPTTVLEPLAKILNTTPACLMGWESSKEENDANDCDYSPDFSIQKKFNQLNNNGQIKAESYIDGLLENPDYVKREKVKTTENTEGLVIDGILNDTELNMVANIGVSEPPKVKKKRKHT